MATTEVIEVIYGKYHKFEIMRRAKMLGGFEFSIFRDGKYYRGYFSDLAQAVEFAKKEK